MRFAAIDIGSNAIRMLFEEVVEIGDEPIFKKLSLIRLPVRLGEDAFLRGHISEQKRSKLLDTAHAFQHLCSVFNVDHSCAAATSAMRTASNGLEIIEEIKNKTGVEIRIIPGEEEAEILFGSIFNTGKVDINLTYMSVDVGGGSTELNFFVKGERKVWRSFNLGAVRMKENIQDPQEWTALDEWISDNAGKYPPDVMIGTGGNINTIFTLAGLKNWKFLTQNMLEKKVRLLKKFTPEELQEQFDIKSDRADVIVHGGSIYLQAMKMAGIQNMLVPKVGVADGLIRKMYFESRG